MSTNMELNEEARKKVAASLESVLNDTFVLYFTAHSFHWNVEGPRFFGLHAAFEEDYTELWKSIDAYAERIRALGAKAPASLARLVSSAEVQEPGTVSDAIEMVGELAAGHNAVASAVRTALRVAQDHGDEASAGLLADQLGFHEQRAWMLGSTLV